MKLKLSCKEGFKNEGWNRVQVALDEFHYAWKPKYVNVLCRWLNELNPDNRAHPSWDCFFIYGAESFSLADLAETIQDVAHHNDFDWEVTYED